MKSAAAIGAILIAAAFVFGPAPARASLESAVPLFEQAPPVGNANLVLSLPSDVDLSRTRIELLDSHQKSVPIEKLELSDNRTDVQVPLRTPLRPGVYTVKWHARGMNGHESHGTYNFNIGN